jgi:hypothetical protein
MHAVYHKDCQKKSLDFHQGVSLAVFHKDHLVELAFIVPMIT